MSDLGVKLRLLGSSGLFFILAYSFQRPEVDPEAVQHRSRLTGYNTWHKETSKDTDIVQRELTTAWTVLSLLLVGLAGVLAQYATSNRTTTRFVGWRKVQSVSATPFHYLLKVYIFSSFISTLLSLVQGEGKLWSALGVATHNFFEVAILLVLQEGGQLRSVYSLAILFVYLIAATTGSIYFSWPNDALFFKWQAACIDTALFIAFARIYTESIRLHGTPIERSSLLAAAQDQYINDTILTIDSNDGPISGNSSSRPSPSTNGSSTFSPKARVFIQEQSLVAISNEDGEIWTHPNQLIILVIASLLHWLATTFGGLIENFDFLEGFLSLIYGTTFGLYAFYLYIDQVVPEGLSVNRVQGQGQQRKAKKVHLPELSDLKIANIFFTCLCCATVAIRLQISKESRDF